MHVFQTAFRKKILDFLVLRHRVQSHVCNSGGRINILPSTKFGSSPSRGFHAAAVLLLVKTTSSLPVSRAYRVGDSVSPPVSRLQYAEEMAEVWMDSRP